MNSYSNETQQNGNPENSKIAGIYQRMLLGDKSALSNLQNIQIHNYNNFSPQQNQSPPKNIKQKAIFQHSQRKSNNNSPFLKNSTYEKIKTINEDPQEDYRQHQNSRQENKRKQKLSSFIKKKVHQLRTEKEIMKYQEQKQLNEIKKISKNIKVNTTNQSKSFDLVKKKEIFTNKHPHLVNTNLHSREQAKQRLQNVNVRESLKKAQSSDQYNAAKHLPPLREKKKIQTQNSENSSQLNDTKISSRKDLRTPINLASSTTEVQSLSNSKIQIKIQQPNKQSPKKRLGTSQKQKLKEKQRRMNRSPSVKISLPEMKRQREQLALINQRQKSCQLQMMQYHQQTKRYLEDLKHKLKLNYKNQDRLKQMKGMFNTQPITSQGSQKQQGSMKRKKNLQTYKDQVDDNYKDISLIEEMISKKKMQSRKINEKLGKNQLMKFWSQHDLNTSDFYVEQQEDEPEQFSQKQDKLSVSQMNEAYSTAMPSTRDKNWKWKVIKQYDTNRSFQEYAKSRSQFKQSSYKKDNLNQIDENDEQEEISQNKVTVNSRLKKMLLQ